MGAGTAGKMQVNTTAALMVLVAICVAATSTASGLDFYPVEAADRTSLEAKGSASNGACCDLCWCTRSFPPQCKCADSKRSCYDGCKACRCTKSFPPQCMCLDVKDFSCYPSCNGGGQEFQK